MMFEGLGGLSEATRISTSPIQGAMMGVNTHSVCHGRHAMVAEDILHQLQVDQLIRQRTSSSAELWTKIGTAFSLQRVWFVCLFGNSPRPQSIFHFLYSMFHVQLYFYVGGQLRLCPCQCLQQCKCSRPVSISMSHVLLCDRVLVLVHVTSPCTCNMGVYMAMDTKRTRPRSWHKHEYGH